MIRAAMATLVGLMMLAPGVSSGQSYVVVVTGLAGDPQYADTLHRWATSFIEAARESSGVPESHILYLAEPKGRDARIRARSTKENVTRELRLLADRSEPDAEIMIVLLGHGSYRNDQSRFNLPGPDLTAEDFAELLALFPTQQMAFVNAASASGEFIPVLSGERRVIVTATKSGFERNQTLFGSFFTAAFAQGGADVDKNQHVSILEAFQYARSEVARAYEQQKRLLTEHAQLDDNGDGRGSTEPGPDAPDGALAQLVYLGDVTPVATATDPRLATLYKEKEGIERRLAVLRAEKDGMDAATYEQRLEELLLALAQTSSRIRDLERESREP
jgi:hypothetical protein